MADPTWSFIRRDERLMPRGTKPFHSVSRDLEEHEIRKGTEWLRYGAGRRKCSLGKLLDEGMTHIMAVVGG